MKNKNKISIGDDVCFSHWKTKKMYVGIVEETATDPMEKALVRAWPVEEPTRKSLHRIELYKLSHYIKPVWKNFEEPLKSDKRTYKVRVDVKIEIAKKLHSFSLEGETEASSIKEALEKLMSREHSIKTTNSLGREYIYKTTWERIKKKALHWDQHVILQKKK
jgi:hypothetical protein